MDIPSIHKVFLTCNGASTDTRKIAKNTMFFALKGANFNGNEYAARALNQGANYAVVDEEKFAISDQYILVDNTLTTLQELAKYHRKHLGIPIISLTGSNGKTTTKELINCVLSSGYRTVATQGNLNNHIGVPLTLLSMDKNTEIGIVEMGANHQGEIDFLCNIAAPDYGYITNIGKAHLEGFGGIEGVLKGKTELYRHLKKSNKLVFLNMEDPKLVHAANGMEVFSFSERTDSDIQINMDNSNAFVSVKYKDVKIESNLTGTYNFYNIAAAIAVGIYFKISTEKIKSTIESYLPTNNRSQILKKGKHTIILDAYNANPSSMEVAIQNFDNMKHTSKSMFLGDMFELGIHAREEHQKIVDLATKTGVNYIYLIGENFNTAHAIDSRIRQYNSFNDFASDRDQLTFGEGIFIKGSRGMQLERILELI